MDYRVHCTFAGCGLNNEAAEIAAANYPLIRFANIPWNPSATPKDASTVKTSWSVTSPTTVSNFSAAGYFFSRELAKSMPGVAIGFILGSFGSSCIQCWMSKDSLGAIPSVATLLAQFEANPDYTNQHNPYICYNGQIAPLIPYAIHGVIWYQGESVTWGGNTYRDLQVGLVNSWRKAWGQDFTFLIVQLPNYNVSSSGWPILREAQLQTTQMLANTGLAVTIDIGVSTYVHPPDKQDVGLRLGLAAEAITYGQNVAYSGPLYDHMAIEGSSIRLYFTHTEAGMAFKGGTSTGFEIAGADGTYATATAAIQPDSTILVSAASVTAPKNARYCWAGDPTPSLFSQGTPALPASPFRTDAPALPAPLPGLDGGVVPKLDANVISTGDAAVYNDSSVVPGKDASASGGSGGNPGSGGTSGGSSGSGGNPGSGGKTGSGGSPGSGGSGGNVGSGGSAVLGGSLVLGGTPSLGGTTSSGGNVGAGGSIGMGGSSGKDAAASIADAASATAGTNNNGCSCRLGSRPSGASDTTGFVLGLLLILGARRIRQKSRPNRG
jgi:sialate O-acetylesterase